MATLDWDSIHDQLEAALREAIAGAPQPADGDSPLQVLAGR